MVNAPWRKNPFTGVLNSLLIEDEEHTIEYHVSVNAYGFYANEGVVLDANDPVILTQDNTALTAFTEIPKTIAPNAGQFRVDYDEDGYFNTGFVECNAADVGTAMLFTYYGTGTILHPTFRLQTDFNLPGNMYVEGNAELHGSVVLASGTGAEISASSKTVDDIADPTEEQSAVTKSYLTNNTGFRLFTADGTWTCPPNITQVSFFAVGGGGGGASAIVGANNGYGGGGAAAAYGVQTVTPGAAYAYSVGAGGAGGDGTPNDAGANGGGSTIFGVTANGGGGAGVGSAGVGGVGGDYGGDGGDGGANSGTPVGAGGGGAAGWGGSGIDGATSGTGGAGGKAGGFPAGRGGDGGQGSGGGAVAAQDGFSYGGGGGGGNSNATDKTGGNGGGGCILLIY
jgi:hypothetical protein